MATDMPPGLSRHAHRPEAQRRQARRAVRSVVCPFCQAECGEPCRAAPQSDGLQPRRWASHAQRWEAHRQHERAAQGLAPLAAMHPDPRSVACPECGVPTGAPCRQKNPGTAEAPKLRTSSHRARWIASREAIAKKTPE